MRTDPQPPRPTIEAVNAAYREGLFTCEVESAHWDGRRRATRIPDHEAAWFRYREDRCSSMPRLPHHEPTIGWMVFPWGRIGVADWTGWHEHMYRPWHIIAEAIVDLPPMQPGPWRSSRPVKWKPITWTPSQKEIESRLLDAGFWTAERAMAYSDEAPFARAAWADPAAYLVYADYMDEQGAELTARALRRVHHLTCEEVAR